MENKQKHTEHTYMYVLRIIFVHGCPLNRIKWLPKHLGLVTGSWLITLISVFANLDFYQTTQFAATVTRIRRFLECQLAGFRRILFGMWMARQIPFRHHNVRESISQVLSHAIPYVEYLGRIYFDGIQVGTCGKTIPCKVKCDGRNGMNSCHETNVNFQISAPKLEILSWFWYS